MSDEEKKVIESAKLFRATLQAFSDAQNTLLQDLKDLETATEERLLLEPAQKMNFFKSIAVAPFSTKLYNALYHHGISYIGDLAQLSDIELLRMKGVGRKARKEIKEWLASHNMALGTLIENWDQLRDIHRNMR